MGLILVAIAGPLVNLLLSLLIVFGLTLLPGYADLATAGAHCAFVSTGQEAQRCLSSAQPGYLLRIDQFAFTFALTNLVLAIINIIPLHPLDGYRVLFALLPSQQAVSFRRFEPYMELLLLVIFFVVPYIFAFLTIAFSPGDILINWALQILSSIAPHIRFFYLAL
jgi:Zn-dependent protease